MITEKVNRESCPIKYIFMKSEDIWTCYFISDIQKDKKLEEVVAFERKLIAKRFISIIDKTTENIFGVSCKAIQTHFGFIRDEFKEQKLTDVFWREFKLDKVKTMMIDRKLGFKVTGQSRNIRIIRADLKNGKKGKKSFVFDSVNWILKRLIIKRTKVEWYEDKYFRWFDSETAKKIIEVENQLSNNNFKSD